MNNGREQTVKDIFQENFPVRKEDEFTNWNCIAYPTKILTQNVYQTLKFKDFKMNIIWSAKGVGG